MRRTTDERTLSPGQLVDALTALGWKQAEFARRTGMSTTAVNRWATGRDPAPLWATAYLEAMLDLAMLHRKYLAPVPREQPATPDDSAQAPLPARLAHHLPAPPETD
jgi:transcriptional regulator with XRE-family HTH domain